MPLSGWLTNCLAAVRASPALAPQPRLNPEYRQGVNRLYESLNFSPWQNKHATFRSVKRHSQSHPFLMVAAPIGAQMVLAGTSATRLRSPRPYPLPEPS